MGSKERARGLREEEAKRKPGILPVHFFSPDRGHWRAFITLGGGLEKRLVLLEPPFCVLVVLGGEASGAPAGRVLSTHMWPVGHVVGRLGSK